MCIRDSYLSEWRKAEPYLVEGDPSSVAKNEAEKIEIEFNQLKLKTLIENDGWR